MENNLNIRQIEVDTWIRSKLDVEEYALLLESSGSITNFVYFIEDLVNKIDDGYKPNEVEFRICKKLGLIKQRKLRPNRKSRQSCKKLMRFQNLKAKSEFVMIKCNVNAN